MQYIEIKIKTNEYQKPQEPPKELPRVVYRQDLGVLMEFLNGKTMIEIGTHKGWFAKDLLSKWPSFEKYYGIDPWKEQRFYKDAANLKEEYQIKAYEYALKSLIEFKDRIILYKDFSKNVAKKFESESIDFIYLDGRHDYCGVMSDLKLYYEKLKCDGVMAGNAYLTVAEQFHLSNDDFSLCENGDIVLQNGGGVKGKKIFFSSLAARFIHQAKIMSKWFNDFDERFISHVIAHTSL
jgi:hypothetical protein